MRLRKTLPVPHQTCALSLRLGCVVNVAHKSVPQPLIKKCYRTPVAQTWTADVARLVRDGARRAHLGAYAGVRLGEAQNLGPAEKERDHTLEPSARRTRNNEPSDAVSRKPRLHHAKSRKPTACRRPSSAARLCSKSSAGDAQLPQTCTKRPRQQRTRQQWAQCGAEAKQSHQQVLLSDSLTEQRV